MAFQGHSVDSEVLAIFSLLAWLVIHEHLLFSKLAHVIYKCFYICS